MERCGGATARRHDDVSLAIIARAAWDSARCRCLRGLILQSAVNESGNE